MANDVHEVKPEVRNSRLEIQCSKCNEKLETQNSKFKTKFEVRLKVKLTVKSKVKSKVRFMA